MLRNWNESFDFSVDTLCSQVREKMPKSGEISNEQVLLLCREVCSSNGRFNLLNAAERERLIHLIFCSLRCELEILQDLADDPSITEIMVNGKDDIFVERHGKIERTDIHFESADRLEHVIQRLAAKVGREINDLNPIVDARLSDGSRVNAVAGNIALNGPILTIRKFGGNRLSMSDLISNGDISADAAAFLKCLVKSGYNIFVCGGTSSGKTTFLNILSDFIPPDERLIVIEDSAELAIRGHENLIRLEAKNANAQGKGEITIRDLIKTSLRMRPDRVIVGEVRGEEVVDMLAAMSTGHDGSLSTGHGNSPLGMLGRLETLFISATDFPVESVRNQITEAIDILVHLAKTPDGHRRVMEICELEGIKDASYKLNSIYKYRADDGLVFTGNVLKRREKLELSGVDSDGLFGI